MFLLEKTNLVGPGESSGRARFSALRGYWRQFFSGDQTLTSEDRILLARIFDRQSRSPELRGLTGTLDAIRRKIVTSTLLQTCTEWLVWLAFGLILVAVASTKLAAAVIFIAGLAAVGAACIAIWTWRNRPSHYEIARRLDSASGLQDRLSTAIFLGGQDTGGLAGEQRKDALARLAKVDPRGMFPVEWPRNIKRAAAVVLVAAGLFVYRMDHQPPLVSLLQSTARSQLVQSILAPLAQALEKDLQRTMAMVTMKPDAANDETKRGDAASNSDDLWKADDKAADAADQKNIADAADQRQDQMQPPGDQQGAPSGEMRQDSNSQSQENKDESDSADGKPQDQSEQSGPEGRQSVGQSLMQALKNMVSKSPNQQSNSRPDQQPPNGQGDPQSGNSQQPGAQESDKRGDSKGTSDSKQKSTQTASEGAGSQQGSKELRKDQETHPVNAVPDRVALEAGGFKDQTRMKVAPDTGTARLAVRDASPQQEAATNGAEQENIPARYRLYVQRYFEHADDAKH